MEAQNSFSTQSTPGPIFGADLPAEPAKKSEKKRPLLFVLAGVLVLGLGVGAYFLFFNKPHEEEYDPLAGLRTNYVSDSTKSEEEMTSALDEKISSASTDEEVFNETLRKANYLYAIENYESALSVLQTLSADGRSDYEQYALYNTFASVYSALGDSASAANYKSLADAAHDRDLAGFSVE